MPVGASSPIPIPRQPPPPPPPVTGWRRLLVPAAFFLLALVLYGTLVGAAPFPGAPAHALVDALRLDGPGVSSAPVWETLVRLSARAGLPPAAAMNVFSLFCGALGIAILVWLVLQMPYRTVPGAMAADVVRERQARVFAAVSTGLYLLASTPWALASTRSLPQTFHLLVFGIALWLLARHAQTGRDRWLFALGGWLAAGSLEYPFFWPLLLLMPIAVAVSLFHNGRLGSGRSWLLWLLGLLLGASAYVLHAWHLIRSGHATSASLGGTLLAVLANRAEVFLPYRHPGLLSAFALAWVPVLVLFLGSRRSPWYYGKDQMFLRLVLAVLAVAWLPAELALLMRITRTVFVALLPDAALAVAVGCIAGEFWIHGQRQLDDNEWPRRFYRGFHSALAWVLPVALAGVVFWQRPVADARPASIVYGTARTLLSRMAPGDRIAEFGSIPIPGDGGMADLLRLANLHPDLMRGQAEHPCCGGRVLVFDWSRLADPSYFLWARARWTDPVPAADAATPTLFSNHILRQMAADPPPPGAHDTVFLVPPPTPLPGIRLVPDGWLYRPVPSPTPWSPVPLPPDPTPFWDVLARAADRFPSDRNPAAQLFRSFLALISRNADAYGVLLAESGDPAAADRVFGAGLALSPDNLSLLANRIPPDALTPIPATLPAGADSLQTAMYDREGRLWGLDLLYGPILDPETRATHPDWLFVCSGIPPDRLSALSPGAPPPDDPLPPDVWERIFRHALAPAPTFPAVFSRLRTDPRDSDALLALLRLFILHHRPELAASTLTHLVRIGFDEELLQPEIACIERLRGNIGGSVEHARRHLANTPSDISGWLAILCWTAPPDPLFAQAVQILQERAGHDREIRLALGLRYCELHDWPNALDQYNRALQLRSAPPILLRLITLSRILQDGSIGTLRASLRRTAPDHPIFRASLTRRPEDPETAARTVRDLRELARATRNPELLNAVCESILYVSGSEDPEMRGWMHQAIHAQPWNPVFHCTLTEMLMLAGELKEAAEEARRSVAYAPDFAPAWVLSGELFRRAGKLDQARRCLRRAEVLPQGALSPTQHECLSTLRSALAALPEPAP
ncbi:MAG: hypothetical protein IKO01_03890 [Kiritimatiellae bacterium]|nr:hypothetical protein [Kiritimatiellia bacterium]